MKLLCLDQQNTVYLQLFRKHCSAFELVFISTHTKSKPAYTKSTFLFRSAAVCERTTCTATDDTTFSVSGIVLLCAATTLLCEVLRNATVLIKVCFIQLPTKLQHERYSGYEQHVCSTTPKVQRFCLRMQDTMFKVVLIFHLVVSCSDVSSLLTVNDLRT